MALITTETRTGELKRRLILDCRVSGTDAATIKWDIIPLPRILDVLQDIMTLQAITLDDGSELSYFVCDFPDAFFAVPLNPQERCYFATQYMGYTYVWNRVTQVLWAAPRYTAE